MKKRNRKKKRKPAFHKNAVMALSFGALNIADYWTTKIILKNGGRECNPVVDFFIQKNKFGVFKIATTLTGMFSIYTEEKPQFVSIGLLGLYGFVVGHNLKEIVLQKREAKMGLGSSQKVRII